MYNSIFNITQENNKFELYFENIQKSKDLIEKNPGVSNIENDDLLDEEIRYIIIEDNRKKN